MSKDAPKIKVKIYPCPNKRMAGAELRRAIREAETSERQVARKMGLYRSRIRRWEKLAWFELEPHIMQELLNALNASSI